MKFIDEVEITIRSGKGGKGASHFRREKFIPLGGPDGGNGGNGGSVIFIGDENLNTLIHFRGKKVFAAEDGKKGEGRQCDGKNGQDMVLRVPLGTLVKDCETGELIVDIKNHEEQITLLKGGRGGFGNMYFKTSTNQAPTHAGPGEEGSLLRIKLELKLIADYALIGLPNAGKSTMISSLSSARPKIADYPFTTIEPGLGVVSYQDKACVVADIPGLIEDAALGKGLGIKFLKHIERTKALIHLVDISWCLDFFEAFDSYVTIREELKKYGHQVDEKPEIVVLTKIDALREEEIKLFKDFFEEQLEKKVLCVSAVSNQNIEQLKRLLIHTKENLK